MGKINGKDDGICGENRLASLIKYK